MSPQSAVVSKEQRRYIRLNSVFPVQWRILSEAGNQVLSDSQTGFTSNVSRGGLCLALRNLSPEIWKLISEGKVIFSLEIEMPFQKKPITALGKLTWLNHRPEDPDRYLVGLEYSQISPALNGRIVGFARAKILFVPVTVVVVLVLAAGFWVNYARNKTLADRNKMLTDQLVTSVQEAKKAKAEIDAIVADQQALRSKLESAEAQADRMVIQARIDELGQKGTIAAMALQRLDLRKAVLQKATADKMLQWLCVHQNPRTGLVMSFEGDRAVEEWAFSYDQALAGLAYLRAGDVERSGKILHFYATVAQRSEGLFYNAYYVKDGMPAEYTVHSGPNVWIGIAALQYSHATGDTTYFALAEQIAAGLLRLQAQDADGGLRGGPAAAWYATEHNLDAYAFFSMLYEVTAKPEYAQSRDAILGWLKKHAYDKPDVPVRRGKGDSTIATDTYAWSIASIGPVKLKEMGMDPDAIMAFAEQYCGIEVEYARPEGQRVKIRGFDFAPTQHMARAGVISSEWTAQMALSFKILARYSRAQGDEPSAKIYDAKAEEYLGSLAQMVIASPSPTGQGQGCLPYATADSVDTGHGWVTPKGRSTGSIAGTAYTLFAYEAFNPLELRKKQ